jgi:hypothetical protein
VRENTMSASQPSEYLDEIHTSCGYCKLAVFNEDHKQYGCFLNRLPKYIEQGNTVHGYNDDMEFYIINGRRCPAKKLAENKPDATLEELHEYVKERTTIDYSPLLYLDEFINDGELRYIIRRLANQTLKPNRVVVINNTGMMPGEMAPVVKEVCDFYKVPWKIQTILEEDADEGRALDITVRLLTSHLYGVYHPKGLILEENYWETLNTMIRDELQDIIAIKPDEYDNGFVCSVMAHVAFGGYIKKPLIDKLVEFARIKGRENAIKESIQVWNRT